MILLSVLTALAGVREGFALVAPGLLGAVGVAAAIDAVVIRLRRGAWEFPSGAILTGQLIAMVLSPQEPWYVAAITSAIAIASKYLIRTRTANVFNPAAIAIVATFYLLHAGQSWWGALPELPMAAVIVLLAAGVFMADRVNRMPIALAFLGSYFLLFTISAFAGDPNTAVEIFRQPDLHAALFFAFFILTDPPTSPVKVRDQVVCGIIVAASSVAVFEMLGAAHYLLSGLLVGNIWEAWRRTAGRRVSPKRFARRRKPALGVGVSTSPATRRWWPRP